MKNMFIPVFTFHNIVLYFVYGLTFFVMGLAIFLQSSKNSDLRLAKKLRYLAAFGISHGLAEWLFAIIRLRLHFEPHLDFIPYLATLFALKVGSYVFLLYFGLTLYYETKRCSGYIKLLPPLLLILWLVAFFWNVCGNWLDLYNWRLGEVWSRYLLAFPASVMAGYALTLQIPEFSAKGMPLALQRNLRQLAGVMFCYALFGGLIVPYAEFFPANVLNSHSFFEYIHIPVQVFRALCGLLFALLTIRMITFYDHEMLKLIQQGQKTQTVFEERERFACDLHDGVIQGIYGEGLHLESVANNLKDEKPDTASELTLSIKRLNDIIYDIRSYISDLRPALRISSLQQAIQDLISELSSHTYLKISLQISDAIPALPQETTHHLLLILRESLHNVIRHAQAENITIICDIRQEKLYISIIDDGIGCSGNASDACQNGIANSTKRVKQLGGVFKVTGYPNRGTEVSLVIPL